MSLTSRPISSLADLQLMAALSNRSPLENLRLSDLPYRFSSWALDEPENTRLWFDPPGSLVGWAVMQTPFWTIDYACDPAFGPGLHAEILAWASGRARGLVGTDFGRPCWFVMAFADRPEQIQALEAAGFASQADVGEDSWSKVFLARPAGLPLRDYRIPAGFTIRPLAGDAEVEAYVDLHRTTFESKNMTVEWRRRTLQHPDYLPELDLVVTAPDGRLAAFCICWLNRHGAQPVGQVEPLGCHPDFRRYALGRLALIEGLRRLQACGAQTVYVETDSYRDTARRLYEAVGFQVVRDVLVFRKDFG